MRAEPVAALYEKARVRHVKGLRELKKTNVRDDADGVRGHGIAG